MEILLVMHICSRKNDTTEKIFSPCGKYATLICDSNPLSCSNGDGHVLPMKGKLNEKEMSYDAKQLFS